MGLNLIPLTMRSPKKSYLKLMTLRGISKFALYCVMLTGRTQEMKISLFDLLSMFYPININ